ARICRLSLHDALPILAAAARRRLDCHQVAVPRIRLGAGRDRELLAELLLVDRHEPPAAPGRGAEDAEHALLGAVDELDDASAVRSEEHTSELQSRFDL